MRVVLILMDAFRYDYLDEQKTPFLYSLAQNGLHVKQIIPSHGFCERTEILTGMEPNDSGYFTAIGYDPKESPYRNNVAIDILGKLENAIKYIKRILGLENHSMLYRKIVKRIFSRYFGKFTLGPYNIPFAWLKEFNLTEDKEALDKQIQLRGISVYSLLEQAGRGFYVGAFTGLSDKSGYNDADRLDASIQQFQNGGIDFMPVYIGSPDSYGHKYGPHSEELTEQLAKNDIQLENYIRELRKIDPNVVTMILGDHGMSRVDDYFDAGSQIDKLIVEANLIKGKDVIYFLDSTFVRIWLFTEQSRVAFQESLKRDPIFLQKGFFLDSITSQKYKIPYADSRYGDVIWWANEGTMICPDFFHSLPVYKGMHGYRDNGTTTRGMLVVSGATIKREVFDDLHLNRVYNLINKYLA